MSNIDHGANRTVEISTFAGPTFLRARLTQQASRSKAIVVAAEPGPVSLSIPPPLSSFTRPFSSKSSDQTEEEEGDRRSMVLHAAAPASAPQFARFPSTPITRAGGLGSPFVRVPSCPGLAGVAGTASPFRATAVRGLTKAFASTNGLPETSESSHVVCFGEMLIDFVPTTSGLSLAEASAFKKAPGGAPANVAVGISRLGGSAAFIGKVGEDEFGYMLADILKENNVNNKGMRFDPGARTALAFVTLRKDGEREFMFYRNPSADMLLEEGELDLDIIRKAKIFHYGSISLITEPCKSAHIAAAKAAKDAGVLLSYDPNLRLPLWPSAESARDGILSIWDVADIIKISEEEISFLTKGEDPYDDAIVRKLFHPNLKLLLVTEGPNGCRYYSKEFNGRVSGLKVDTVDTTGAGDAFVAGILSQLAADISLLRDESRLREALKFANACGALTVKERGAIPALPTREAVVNALVNMVV